MRKAFTLIEFIVAMAVTVVLITAIYSAYLAIYKGYRRESLSTTTQAEAIIGIETIRQDVEHAGYGFSEEEYSSGNHLPIEVANDTSGQRLTIRSTFNTSNSATQGWAMLSCSGSGAIPACLAWENFPYCETPPQETWAVLLDPDGGIVNPQGSSQGYFHLPGDRCPSS